MIFLELVITQKIDGDLSYFYLHSFAVSSADINWSNNRKSNNNKNNKFWPVSSQNMITNDPIVHVNIEVGF